MKKLPLVGGSGALVAIVDDADFPALEGWGWLALKCGRNWYAYGSSPEGRAEWMHIEIMGRKRGHVIDHINGDGLLNVRRNLRHVTQKMNMRNTWKHRAILAKEAANGPTIAEAVSKQFKGRKWNV